MSLLAPQRISSVASASQPLRVLGRYRQARQAAAIAISGLSLLNIGLWISVASQPCLYELSSRVHLWRPVFALSLAFLSLVAVLLVWFACSPYLLRVATLLLLDWFSVFVALAQCTLECNVGGPFAPFGSTGRLNEIPRLVVAAAILVYFTNFACARLRVLECTMFEPLGSKTTERIYQTLVVDLILFLVLVAIRIWFPKVAGHLLAVSFWYGGLALIAVLIRVMWSVVKVARLVAAAHRQVRASKRFHSTGMVGELGHSKHAAEFLLIGTFHATVTFWLSLFCGGANYNLLWPGSANDVPSAWALQNAAFCLDRLTNGFSCCLYSGMVGGSLFADRVGMDVEHKQRAKRALATKFFRPSSDAGWQQKVEELADMGFTMRALLKFYKKLGTAELMPHFEGDLNTTLDVVRQAIIPLSREARSSLASVIMGGAPVRPNKMITHNWANLFRDLVAGIVAEALGEDEYFMAAYWLDHDIALVEEWLLAASAMDATYWVCALSVNQHAGICGGNPQGERDNASGMCHPVCDCGLAKFFNDTPPFGNNGQSARCEMNKFDDMLAFLGASNPSFRHVIAVDRNFTLFSRAWCIAEISKAFDFGIPQNLMLPSSALLRKNEASLCDLRVEDMQATRPEDAEAILAKIPDKAAFNRQLQHLVHDKLLVSWKALDEGQRLQRAGRIARWQHACQMRAAGVDPWRSCLVAKSACASS